MAVTGSTCQLQGIWLLRGLCGAYWKVVTYNPCYHGYVDPLLLRDKHVPLSLRTALRVGVTIGVRGRG